MRRHWVPSAEYFTELADFFLSSSLEQGVVSLGQIVQAVEKKEDRSSRLLGELKAIFEKPETQLREERCLRIFRKYMDVVLDAYEFNVENITPYETARLYSAADLKKIENELKEAREAVNLNFSSVCAAFDFTRKSLFRHYQVVTDVEKSKAQEPIQPLESKPTLVWSKVGDFEKRTLEYRGTLGKTVFEKIKLSPWKASNEIIVFIYIFFENRRRIKEIEQIFINQQCRASSTDMTSCTFHFSSLREMEKFLRILSDIDSSIQQIAEELRKTAAPYLPLNVSLPFENWRKRGELKNKITYTNDNPRAQITYIELDKWPCDGKYRINMEAVSFRKLHKFLNEKGYKNEFGVGGPSSFAVLITTAESLERFLMDVSSFDASISWNLIENIIRVFFPQYGLSHKISFFMGLHREKNQKSSMRFLQESPIFDPQLMKSVLSFL